MQTLITVCQLLLGVEKIGAYDNVVELGADSMFTMQLSNEVARIYRVLITPHHLFQEPTIASLAEKIGYLLSSNAALIPQTGANELSEYARLLDFIEDLSDDETEQLLGNRLP